MTRLPFIGVTHLNNGLPSIMTRLPFTGVINLNLLWELSDLLGKYKLFKLRDLPFAVMRRNYNNDFLGKEIWFPGEIPIHSY